MRLWRDPWGALEILTLLVKIYLLDGLVKTYLSEVGLIVHVSGGDALVTELLHVQLFIGTVDHTVGQTFLIV